MKRLNKNIAVYVIIALISFVIGFEGFFIIDGIINPREIDYGGSQSVTGNAGGTENEEAVSEEAGELPSEEAVDPTKDAGTEDAEGSKAATREPKARVAIIIDDLGGNRPSTDELMSLGIPLSTAVLPYAPYSRLDANRAHEAGYQVLLHLPMEPLDENQSPGPGAITCDMSDEMIAKQVLENLAQIPHATAVNNHMGSKATSDERVMNVVLKTLKEKGITFIDSSTTPFSVSPSVAEQLGIHILVNNVFLDSVDEPEAIRAKIQQMVKHAKKNGYAIAIGHVRPNTMAVLKESLDYIKSEGIEFVTIDGLKEYLKIGR